MLHCCETQLEGEKFRQQVTDNLPVEFLVQLNFLERGRIFTYHFWKRGNIAATLVLKCGTILQCGD